MALWRPVWLKVIKGYLVGCLATQVNLPNIQLTPPPPPQVFILFLKYAQKMYPFLIFYLVLVRNGCFVYVHNTQGWRTLKGNIKDLFFYSLRIFFLRYLSLCFLKIWPQIWYNMMLRNTESMYYSLNRYSSMIN